MDNIGSDVHIARMRRLFAFLLLVSTVTPACASRPKVTTEECLRGFDHAAYILAVAAEGFLRSGLLDKKTAGARLRARGLDGVNPHPRGVIFVEGHRSHLALVWFELCESDAAHTAVPIALMHSGAWSFEEPQPMPQVFSADFGPPPECELGRTVGAPYGPSSSAPGTSSRRVDRAYAADLDLALGSLGR